MTDRRRRAPHVAIVNYFTSSYLTVLLPQLMADGAASVTVLDNSCDDAEWHALSQHHRPAPGRPRR